MNDYDHRKAIQQKLHTLKQEHHPTYDHEHNQWWRITAFDRLNHHNPIHNWGCWQATPEQLNAQTDPQTGITYHTGGNWYAHQHNPERPNHDTPGLLHQINTDGDHWHEHQHNPHTITLGCSVTAAAALPHNYGWPHIHQHHTGHTTNNIATPGQNIWYNVQKLFKHIQKYGNPQQILLLAPPLDRHTGPHNHHPLNTYSTQTLHNNPHTQQYETPNQKTPTKHRDTNLNGQKTTPSQNQAIWQNLTALDLLTTYTQTNNIKLVTLGWEPNTNATLNILNYPHHQHHIPPHLHKQPNEPTTPDPNWHEFGNINHPHITKWLAHPTHCPCDLQPQTPHQQQLWDHAANKHWKHPNPHPGLHRQIHYYEILTGNKIDNNTLKTLHPFWHNTTITPPT